MALSYSLRVACVIALSLGLLQISFEVLLRLASPLVLRLIKSLSLRNQERSLFIVQLTPVILALLLTAFFLVPQYIANETNFAAERVGWFCLLFALAFYLGWTVKLLHALRMVIQTTVYSRGYRRSANISPVLGRTPIIIVAGPSPRVALIGLVRPFISISGSLLGPNGLPPQALQIVLDHELSHAAQRDNWKLLALHCIPRLDIRPSQNKTWMQLWQNAAEWAADEDAVVGNRDRALLLAETLVALARVSSTTRPQVLCTYLVCEDTDLVLRVERLLHTPPQPTSFSAGKLAATCSLMALLAAASFATLSFILRDLPEHLLHLG
jgi:hypothetical protein